MSNADRHTGMRLPKKVRINGKFWPVKETNVGLGKDLGRCVKSPKRAILVKKNQTDHEKKVTLVHEMLHEFMWFLDEACVEQIATDVVDALEDCEE